MNETTIVQLITGPAGALVITVCILFYLAKTLVPMLKEYLTQQNKNLAELVKALEKTVDEHAKDRITFESAISNLSVRIEKVEHDVEIIKEKV